MLKDRIIEGQRIPRISLITIGIFCFLAAQSAFAAPLKIINQDMGLEFSSITYREQPSLMTEKGIMYGLFYSLSILDKAQWKVDGRLSTGTVDYTGQYMDGTPVSVSGIRDTMFEARALRGFMSPNAPIFNGPYWGLGYRYLYDQANKGEGGYRRKSNYYYLPLGFEKWQDPSSESSWMIGFSIEFDYLLFGKQISYMSDVGFEDVTNYQHDGYGWRGSVKFNKNDDDHEFTLEPYFRYWNIEKSIEVTKIIYYQGNAYSATFYEPANTSTEIGIKCAVHF